MLQHAEEIAKACLYASIGEACSLLSFLRVMLADLGLMEPSLEGPARSVSDYIDVLTSVLYDTRTSDEKTKQCLDKVTSLFKELKGSVDRDRMDLYKIADMQELLDEASTIILAVL